MIPSYELVYLETVPPNPWVLQIFDYHLRHPTDHMATEFKDHLGVQCLFFYLVRERAALALTFIFSGRGTEISKSWNLKLR